MAYSLIGVMDNDDDDDDDDDDDVDDHIHNDSSDEDDDNDDDNDEHTPYITLCNGGNCRLAWPDYILGSEKYSFSY